MTQPDETQVDSTIDDIEDLDDLDDALDSMFGSPALILMLGLLAFSTAVLFYAFTRGSMILIDRWVEGFGWIIAPMPLLVAGLICFWQPERSWLQQAGVVAIGVALANFVMMGIETATSA